MATGPAAVQGPLVAVLAVAVPAGQPLQRGPGQLPVAAPAGDLPPGFAAQQPLRVDPMPPIGRRRPSAEVAAAVEMPATAAAPRLLAGPVGPSSGNQSSWIVRSISPGGSTLASSVLK